ncbi:MAG: hypothetical protein U0X91_04320 [Spirosomataceae bacterium]
MTPFFKYLLINLVIFGLLTIISYRFLKPRQIEKTALPAQIEAQFVTDAALLDTLYRSYKVSLKGTDPIAFVQAKGNFQGKLSEMAKRPKQGTDLDTLFRKVLRRYYFTILLNDSLSKTQKELAGKKLMMKENIEKLTRLKERLEGQIDNISVQPLPTPTIPQ